MGQRTTEHPPHVEQAFDERRVARQDRAGGCIEVLPQRDIYRVEQGRVIPHDDARMLQQVEHARAVQVQADAVVARIATHPLQLGMIDALAVSAPHGVLDGDRPHPQGHPSACGTFNPGLHVGQRDRAAPLRQRHQVEMAFGLHQDPAPCTGQCSYGNVVGQRAGRHEHRRLLASKLANCRSSCSTAPPLE